MEPETFSSQADTNSRVIKVQLSNTKEDYESDFKATGVDSRLQEVENFIKNISDSKSHMYERKKMIIGYSMIYAEGKMVEMLNEVFDNYVLGNYYATIAVASMATERLCYDFLDFVEIKIGSFTLKEEQKEELHHLPFTRMVSFLLKIGIFDEASEKLLLQINNIRNRHIHPKMKDAQKDALEIVNLLCRVLESTLSMFRYYDLKDGKFVRKGESVDGN